MAARKKPPKPPPPPVKDRLSSITSHEATRTVKLDAILGPQWRHWTAIQGRLCGPDGHAFTPEELMELRQVRAELKACEREVASLQRELEEASRRGLNEDQPLPED